MGHGLVPKILLLLLVVFLLIPFRLLSACIRLLHGSRGWWVRLHPWTLLLVSIPVVLLAILAFSGEAPPPLMAKHEASSELEELKLKIAKLESALEENANLLNSKVKQFKENDLLIEEMELNIQYLQDTLNAVKKCVHCSSSAGKRINDIEQEIQHVWTESRKSNFDPRSIELDTNDAEKKLKVLISQLHKVENIVAKHWVQIKQVEQALKLTKTRISKVTKGKESTKAFLESVRNWCELHFPKAAFNNLQKILSMVQQ